MATFAQDTFTDTNGVKLQSHTPDIGGSWVQHTANVNELEINSNRLRQDDTATDTRVYYNNGTPGSADYYVQFVLRFTGTMPANTSFGLLARLDTAALTGYFFRHNNTVGWQAYKVTTGTFTQIGSTTAQTLTLNQDYTVRIDLSGSTITLTVDGSEVCGSPLSDSTHSTAGKVGVRIGLSNNQSGVVDNFIAVDTTSAGSPWLFTLGVGS